MRRGNTPAEQSALIMDLGCLTLDSVAAAMGKDRKKVGSAYVHMRTMFIHMHVYMYVPMLVDHLRHELEKRAGWNRSPVLQRWVRIARK